MRVHCRVVAPDGGTAKVVAVPREVAVTGQVSDLAAFLAAKFRGDGVQQHSGVPMLSVDGFALPPSQPLSGDCGSLGIVREGDQISLQFAAQKRKSLSHELFAESVQLAEDLSEEELEHWIQELTAVLYSKRHASSGSRVGASSLPCIADRSPRPAKRPCISASSVASGPTDERQAAISFSTPERQAVLAAANVIGGRSGVGELGTCDAPARNLDADCLDNLGTPGRLLGAGGRSRSVGADAELTWRSVGPAEVDSIRPGMLVRYRLQLTNGWKGKCELSGLRVAKVHRVIIDGKLEDGGPLLVLQHGAAARGGGAMDCVEASRLLDLAISSRPSAREALGHLAA